jgi:hypothetical protein
MNPYLKDPDAQLDYTIDWSAGYLDGQSITDSQWSVEPLEEGGVSAAPVPAGATRTAANLSGGRAGHVYRVRNRVTLSDGRSDDRSITLRVEER